MQQSTNGGRSWASILTSGSYTRLRLGGCHPARYHTITTLAVTGLLPGTLFVATSGDIGRGPHNRSNAGCDVATGGLYVLRPNGHGGVRRTDSLAAGLPYAQDAQGRTPRAYALLDLTADPGNPDILYADATPSVPGAGGPASRQTGLYRSINGGLYWSPAMAGLPRLHGGNMPRGKLAFDPAHTAIIFDVIGATLYRSTNRGGIWSRPYGIHAYRSLRLYINPANPLLVYALTDLGLFHSRDAGLSWAALSDRRLPAPQRIRALEFNPRDPTALYVDLRHGYALHLHEINTPRPPQFDVAVALTPLRDDRVVVAIHAAPLVDARLAVTAGADRTGARLSTNEAGFGYATLRLTGSVVPRSLRMRVHIGTYSQTLTPWLQPGWVPGRAPTPRASSTPTPTATPTLTPTATVTPTATAPNIPTPYPTSPLTATWTWKTLVSILPPCAPPPTPVVIAPATLTPTAAVTIAASATITPTQPAAGAIATATPTQPALAGPPPTRQPTMSSIQVKPMAILADSATVTSATPAPTPEPTPSATAATSTAPAPTATSSPGATPASVGPCDAGPPLPRQDYAAGWDNADHRLYVFGGTDTRTAAAYNDISAYSTITNAWIAITPATPLPPPRYGAGSAWDPALNMLLVFGGMTGAGPFARFTNDLWGYVPATNSWIALSPNNGSAPAPSPRAHAAAAWDPANNRLLIFGGQTDDNATPTLTNDLWAFTFNGTSGAWADLSPNGAGQDLPPPRQWASIAWDSPAGVLRLFGGKNPGSGSASDTWIWSPLSGWQFDNVPDQPAGRQAAGYYWDETHQRFVVGPGLSMSGNNNDVWFYDVPSHDWLPVPIPYGPTPTTRQMAQMVWDAADGQALLFGGRQTGNGASNDLWALVPTNTRGTPPVPPPAAAPIVKGIDVGQVVSRANNTVLLTPAKVQLLSGAGASYARVSFYIGDGQTSWTQARLHAYEQVITMLGQKGIGVLAVAGSGIAGPWQAASWTQNAHETTGGNGDNPAIDDYVNQLGLLVSHFFPAPYDVRRWEVWNEPNVPLAGCTNFVLSCLQQPSLQPSNFAALLALAFQRVKNDQSISDTQIVSGGIFGHSIGGAYNSAASGAAYIGNTYDEGINRTMLWVPIRSQFGSYPLDLIGEHLYVDQGQRTTPAVIRTYLAWFHDIYAVYEGAAKGTLVTEVGWRTGDTNEPQVTQDVQASNLDTTFTTARRSGYVKDLCWFELQDDPGYLHNTSWGLVDRNGSPKPAYLRFQQQ